MKWILAICGALCISPAVMGLVDVYTGGPTPQATAGGVFFLGFVVAMGLSRIVMILEQMKSRMEPD